jgi:esterase FrsA
MIDVRHSRAAILTFVAFMTLALPSAGRAQPASPSPMEALAELKADIQTRADRQAYPIAGIKAEDVREVLGNIKSLDRDNWAAAWTAMGERYLARGRAAEQGDKPAARMAYHQAWLHFMFAAWPAQTSPGKRAAFAKSTAAFRAYGALLDPPMEVVRIPFEGSDIVGYLQLPKGVRPSPVVISIGGLDEYKEFAVEHFSPAFLERGLGVLTLDMPGTGEAPAKMDLGAERMFSKAIDYLATRADVAASRIAVQGVSAGGYWSALLGYVERARLRGAVVWGAPIHGYFQADWQRKSFGTREYLFGLKEARMTVYGFTDEEKFLTGIGRFSLQTRGVLGQPSAPMLVVNGEKDSQVPIDDLYILLHAGSPKYAWVNPNGGHVGRSAELPEQKIHRDVVVPWLAQILAAGSE